MELITKLTTISQARCEGDSNRYDCHELTVAITPGDVCLPPELGGKRRKERTPREGRGFTRGYPDIELSGGQCYLTLARLTKEGDKRPLPPESSGNYFLFSFASAESLSIGTTKFGFNSVIAIISTYCVVLVLIRRLCTSSA